MCVLTRLKNKKINKIFLAIQKPCRAIKKKNKKFNGYVPPFIPGLICILYSSYMGEEVIQVRFLLLPIIAA